jgi:hypothetical protein
MDAMQIKRPKAVSKEQDLWMKDMAKAVSELQRSMEQVKGFINAS